jgi:hypothetical protein
MDINNVMNYIKQITDQHPIIATIYSVFSSYLQNDDFSVIDPQILSVLTIILKDLNKFNSKEHVAIMALVANNNEKKFQFMNPELYTSPNGYSQQFNSPFMHPISEPTNIVVRQATVDEQKMPIREIPTTNTTEVVKIVEQPKTEIINLNLKSPEKPKNQEKSEKPQIDKSIKSGQSLEYYYINRLKEFSKKHGRNWEKLQLKVESALNKGMLPFAFECKHYENEHHIKTFVDCIFAHNQSEIDDNYGVYFQALCDYHINDDKMIEFIDNLKEIIGDDWVLFNKIIHYKRKKIIPNNGRKCRFIPNCKNDDCTFIHNAHITQFFDNEKNVENLTNLVDFKVLPKIYTENTEEKSHT